MVDQGIVGADVVRLRTLAKTFADAAETLTAQGVQVGTQLGSVPWDGPDAQRYRGEWTATHSVSLRSVAAALTAAGERLAAEAEAQARTSGDAPTGSTGGGVALGGAVGGLVGMAMSGSLGVGGAAGATVVRSPGLLDQVRGGAGDALRGMVDLGADGVRRVVDVAGSAAPHLGKVGNVVKPLGWALDAVDGAREQWAEDAEHGTGERLARAVASGTTNALVEVGVAGIGSLPGWAAGPVGAAVTSYLASEAFDRIPGSDELVDRITDVAADRASDLIDVGESVVELGDDVLRRGVVLLEGLEEILTPRPGMPKPLIM